MKQCGFHWNKAPITHFPRSLFGNLMADSDQLFLPVDIFPPQDLILGVHGLHALAERTKSNRQRASLNGG
jgi:hypothetical protein